jgi:hypothetical protein
MEKVQIEIIERKVIDEKTVASKIKYGNITVHVKSIFGGKKHIEDVLFNMAKEKINIKKCD